MTTTIPHDTLKTALSIATKAATNKTLPVLTTIRLQASELSLALTATDLETAIHVTVASNTDKPFSTCAPASVLANLVQTSDSATIQFKPMPGEKLSLVAGGAKSTLNCLPGDEFPLPPIASNEMGCISASQLRTALKKVLIATSNDQSRPALCAVQFARLKDRTYLAAADGFRLAACQLENEIIFPNDKTSLLIPRGSAVKLAAILPESDEPVSIAITPNASALCFSWSGLKFWAQLSDLKFPDWQAIIPGSFKHELYLPARQTTEAVQRAEIFARENNHTVSFVPSESGMTVTGKSDGSGKSETVLDLSIPSQISFNSLFVRQGLEAIGSDVVHMQFNGPNAPVLFKGSSDRYQYLLMPMSTPEDLANADRVAQAAEESV